jgi:hypothetical protein
LAHLPLRRWRLTIVCFLASVVVAYVVGLIVSEQKWKSDGALEYSIPKVPHLLEGIYSAHSRGTRVDLAKSSDIVAELCKEFNLPIPPEVLSSLFETPQPVEPGSVVLRVSLDWADVQQGAELVNRSMELSRKAAVLPVPVWAVASRSRPARMAGMVSA